MSKTKRVAFKDLGITSTPWKKEKTQIKTPHDSKTRESNKKTLDEFFGFK